MLRGTSKDVTLLIRRQGKQLSIRVSPEGWNQQAVESRTINVQDQRLGYIGIRLFTPDSGNAVRSVVESFSSQGIGQCVVDLRNNPGGYLDAMAVAGSAFTSQVLGWKVRRDGAREPIHSELKPPSRMKIVVLVNGGTASAAEILAEGLRDATGAPIIGSPTFGRGQIQTSREHDSITKKDSHPMCWLLRQQLHR